MVVLFWAAWCTPSGKAIKELDKTYEDFKKAGIEVLAISVDQDAGVASNYVKVNKIQCPTMQDAKGKISAGYGIREIPAVYVIDKQGKIRRFYKDFPGAKKLLEEAKTLT